MVENVWLIGGSDISWLYDNILAIRNSFPIYIVG